MLDPYTLCPCGSGKKFKWCCQAFWDKIDRVFHLQEKGQHAAALALMEEVADAHPTNPEVLGRKAVLLLMNQKVEEAEKAIDRALELNPNYAFGYRLRGELQLAKRDTPGGLVLLRKAVDLTPAERRDELAALHFLIYEVEWDMQRPVAARAALTLAMKANPDPGIAENLEQFGPNALLPQVAVKAHSFKPLAATASAERRAAWEQALQSGESGKLTDAVAAFQALASADENDAAAWYNLGLALAWAGENAQALAALDRYVALESDEAQAAEAWALAQVMTHGAGMEAAADVMHHSRVFRINNPDAFFGALSQFAKSGGLANAQLDREQGTLTGFIMEVPRPALTVELEAKQHVRAAAMILVAGDQMRLGGTDAEAVGRAGERLRDASGGAFDQLGAGEYPGSFSEVWTRGLAYPPAQLSKEQTLEYLRSGFAEYYEDQWIHRPLKALGGIAPIDAASSPSLRKKLLGVLRFHEECAAPNKVPYDFNQLRRKLDLLDAGAASGSTSQGAQGGRDIPNMSASELAGLPAETLNDLELDQAFQAALRLDARELAAHFGQNLTARAPAAEKTDRFSLYQFLQQHAQSQGDLQGALDLVNAGMQEDCTHNQGHRRNDYELRRGQLHAKRGDIPEAVDVFDRLIARAPGELRYRVAATEALLSARQAPHARAFAEAGLAEAQKQNSRDAEGHFRELLDAAQRG